MVIGRLLWKKNALQAVTYCTVKEFETIECIGVCIISRNIIQKSMQQLLANNLSRRGAPVYFLKQDPKAVVDEELQV